MSASEEHLSHSVDSSYSVAYIDILYTENSSAPFSTHIGAPHFPMVIGVVGDGSITAPYQIGMLDGSVTIPR